MQDSKGLFCLCQHFAVWYKAAKNDRPVDFGAPCESCRNQQDCHEKGYPWDDMILPIMKEQGVAITLACREH